MENRENCTDSVILGNEDETSVFTVFLFSI